MVDVWLAEAYVVLGEGDTAKVFHISYPDEGCNHLRVIEIERFDIHLFQERSFHDAWRR